MKYLKTRLKIVGLAAAAVMCVTAIVPPLGFMWVEAARDERGVVEEQLQSLRRIESLLVDAETGQRGYVITGKEAFLEPYLVAVGALPAEFAQLSRRYEGGSARERLLVSSLIEVAHKKLDELARTVALRRSGGFEAVEPVVSSGLGKQHMDDARRSIADLVARGRAELHALDESLIWKIRRATAISLVSAVLTIVLLALFGRSVRSSMQARALAARELETTGHRLEKSLATLEIRNAEILTLGEMSRILQTEMDLAEALEVTGAFCERLVAGTSGAVYLYRNSADILELAGGWGEGRQSVPASVEPASCWALRRGQIHQSGAALGLRCKHCERQAAERAHVCMPLMAHGEILGLLHVWTEAARMASTGDEIVSTIKTVSEQVALSLSNVKLRQVLRDQSIKDPLTGLFNRRYMEETLLREVARARRTASPLAVIVADLDHFKHVNDTYGHPAGDAALKGAARLLQRMTRGSDVACRFGGEEFVLILPDCSKEAAMAKAEEIRQQLAALVLREAGQAIEVTASFGVAACPADGVEAEELLRCADGAMYLAKRGGRNQVKAASASRTAPAAVA